MSEFGQSATWRHRLATSAIGRGRRHVPKVPKAVTQVVYETRFMPGGGHVPSPGGRIEGGAVFGQ
jgi:hypothetical protein